MKKQLLFSSIIAIALYSCDTPKTTSSKDLEGISSIEVTKNQKNKTLIDGYMSIKNAMVKSDPVETQKQAQSFARVIEEGISDGAFPSNEFTLALQTASNDIALSAAIKTQRDYFITFNTAFENYILETGTSTNLYEQHCPMYGENGGTWLSTETEINNPYFGDQMLRCGSVEKQIVLK